MSYKQIPAVLNACKSIAKAYHSSINFARAIHEAQVKVRIKVGRINFYLYFQVQSRPEEERPWAILQDVSTRWNSQLICMSSCLRSEGAIRAVLATEEFRTMKSLVSSEGTPVIYSLFMSGGGKVFTASSGSTNKNLSSA